MPDAQVEIYFDHRASYCDGQLFSGYINVVDVSDSELGLECFCAHTDYDYLNIAAKKPRKQTADLLRAGPNGLPRPGQERFLVIVSEQSCDRWVKAVLCRDKTKPDMLVPIHFRPIRKLLDLRDDR